ncbi:D-alanyl-D-alanine carboxypeptidase family protein [Rhodobium gokarnense]|uniref:D-alanyl-D-alanine carboxypeptidase n=1 Tax=Rhodobium gokarnense TaxID=364296 RepID=A0ABT3HDZ0_9HYPH|nr:D-alanyl-D-alanine carboxypeptidase family protein [Rhodobium gokarnense]MCW2308616.1 D-alanyl-D-alanine carboxypeptidase [Rhodobium gokarnense]
MHFRFGSSAVARKPAIVAAILLACALVQGAQTAPARAEDDIAAYLVMDADSGTVLDSMNPLRPWHPASLTKMMTAYVTFKALKLGFLRPSSPVYYSANARSEPPSKMGFRVGTVLTVDNALKMMLVKSANDVAVAIGETVSGSEAAFVAAMNREAQRLGMRSTRYTNPNGLPDRAQITNARDYAILARALHKDFPEYGHYFRVGAITFGKRTMKNYNILLHHYRGADGFKTGYICDSGLNLVASATRNGRRVVAVVLGARTGYQRAAIARKLLDRGFGKGGGFFSSGGTPVESIRATRTWPALPPKGYCRGAKPKIADLLEQYDRYKVTEPRRDLFGGARPDRASMVSAPKALKKKGKGKLTADEVLDRLVGPPQSYSVVKVYVGGADDNLPAKALEPIDGFQISHRGRSNVLPSPHPLRTPGIATGNSPALAIRPVTPPEDAAKAVSLFSRSGRITGRPEVLLPQKLVPPAFVDGKPLPRPNPRR